MNHMKVYRDCRNPVLPVNLHIPDPEAHVMPDGRVYVYGSWDQEENVYCSREYRVFSSDNMVDWTDHGISFDISRVPWLHDKNAPKYPGLDWSKPTPFLKKMLAQSSTEKKADSPAFTGEMLYAPDAIGRNGKYYLYFCMTDQSEGVAVADKPEGPFLNPIQLPCGGIDPAVFIDDDGQAYYFWGQLRAHGARLQDNMVEFVEGSVVHNIVTEEEHGFHEGSSIRKRGDTYYFVYSCINRGKPTSLAYATSKSPLGPYEYQGIIIDNDGCDPQTWNNHGSIEEVNGQWYVFYHRSSRNSKVWRRLCIEPISFDEDGRIQEVAMTSQGVGRPFGMDEKIEAYRACQLSGSVYIAPLQKDREGLTGIGDGDTAVFRYVQWDEPANRISMEATGSGKVEIYLDGEERPSGNIILDKGLVLSSEFHGPSGKHEIKLKFDKVDNLEVCTLSFS